LIRRGRIGIRIGGGMRRMFNGKIFWYGGVFLGNDCRCLRRRGKRGVGRCWKKRGGLRGRCRRVLIITRELFCKVSAGVGFWFEVFFVDFWVLIKIFVIKKKKISRGGKLF
jgi:hypothetical protein